MSVLQSYALQRQIIQTAAYDNTESTLFALRPLLLGRQEIARMMLNTKDENEYRQLKNMFEYIEGQICILLGILKDLTNENLVK